MTFVPNAHCTPRLLGGTDGLVRAVDTVSGGPPRAADHAWPSAMRDR